MKHYTAVVAVLLTALIIAFAVVEAHEVPVLSDPLPALERGGVVAAAVGVGLLVVDVVVPVPSSAVMLAHGALFGVVGGAVLSLAGAVGATLVGFAIGRRGSPLLARVVPATERRRADALLDRWGLLAVIVTRPVPLLAEGVAVMAGTSTMPARTVVVGAAVGALPAAVLYAVAGALAIGLVSGAVVFGAVIALAAMTWFIGRTRTLGANAGAAS